MTHRLKRYVYRTQKHFPLGKLTAILGSLQEHIQILSDETSRTSNIPCFEDKPPAPLLVSPESIRMDDGTMISCGIDLKKATPETLLPFIALLRPIVLPVSGIAFRRYYKVKTGLANADAKLLLKGDQLDLKLSYSSGSSPEHLDVSALQAAFAFFEHLLQEPGKYTTFVQETITANIPKVFRTDTFTFPGDRFESLVTALLGKAGPAGFKNDGCRLHAVASDRWDGLTLNRAVKQVNAHADLFKEVIIHYYWRLKSHTDYPLLATHFNTVDDKDTDTCLYTFKLPGGAEGILALTYGKKGYRLYASFEEETPIQELATLTKVKFDRFW